MKWITILVFLLFVQADYTCAQTNNSIYKTVLEDYVLVRWKTKKKTRLVIGDSTFMNCKAYTLPQRFKYPSDDSISFYEFIDIGDTICNPIKLSANDFVGLNKKVKYHFLENATINQYFNIQEKTDRWTNFRKKEKVDFGIISFSTIYYSKNGKYACVLISHSCDLLCGQGMFYTLYFDGKAWKIFESYITWVS